MSAGIPGLGLGGLFFVLSALASPFVELARTIDGTSSRAAWRRVARQFTLAVAMIVAVDVSLRLAFICLDAAGLADRGVGGITVLPLAQFAIAAAVLAALLTAAKALQLAVRLRARRRAGVRRLRTRLAPEFD